MTANQINYQKHLEGIRHNIVEEAETVRSNKAKEQETHRANVASEAIGQASTEAQLRNASAALSQAYTASYRASEEARHNQQQEAINSWNTGSKFVDTAMSFVGKLIH